MSVSLNNVATADTYTPANQLNCEGSVKLNIQVFNNPIYYSYMPWQREHPGGGFFNPETFLAPGIYLFARQVQQVKVRSASKGKPAQVTIEALGPDD